MVGGCGACGGSRVIATDACSDARGWRDRANELGKRCEPFSPPFERTLQGEIARHVRLERRALLSIQHAESVLGATQVVVIAVGIVNCSRLDLSCTRLRRIQFFIVPSGTARRCASSLYVAPVKNASRRALDSRFSRNDARIRAFSGDEKPR